MQNDFNFVAPFYDGLARLIFGKAISESQRWLLPFIPEKATVLIIGGGTGKILTDMLEQNNCRQIVYLEASEKMLELSRKRYAAIAVNSGAQVEFRLGTEKEIQPTETFDVVFTGFLLDLFSEENLAQLMDRLNAVLKPHGRWLVADFAAKNATRFWQKSLLQVMVWFFKITARLQTSTIPNLEVAFKKSPLKQLRKQYFYHRLIFAAVYQKS